MMLTATDARDIYYKSMIFTIGIVLERINKAVGAIAREHLNANIVLDKSVIYEDEIINKEDYRNSLLCKLKEQGYLKVQYFPANFWENKPAFRLPKSSNEVYNFHSNKYTTCWIPYIHLNWSK